MYVALNEARTSRDNDNKEELSCFETLELFAVGDDDEENI